MLERNTSREQMDFSSNTSAHMGREQGFGTPVMVLLAAVMLLLICVIVLGNALVILAFKTDRSLRRQSNYFLLNLAISDFLVGKKLFCFLLPIAQCLKKLLH
ncbi:histamine H3 receptor [Tachysurus ichikawai]